jgi:2-C-methyl-D-erythritol 4-phosphate cytidylyltransferase
MTVHKFMYLGILLAAGTSTRFDHQIPKQLYDINGRSLISYSVDILSRTLDDLIIVTNSRCLADVQRLHPGSTLLVNDINCRIESIKTALDFISPRADTHLVIHDAARPFIKEEHVLKLIDSSKTNEYSQYYLKLVNGLVRKTGAGYETVDRDEYLELVTPQMCELKLFDHVFRTYIQRPDRTVWEILTVCNELGIKYNLIEGHHRHFRKITTTDDLDS